MKISIFYKKFFCLLIVLSSFALVACDDNTSSRASSTSESSSISTKAKGEDQQNATVEYYNELLAFKNAAIEPLEKIGDVTEKVREYADRKSPASRPNWSLALIGSFNYKKVATMKVTPPAFFSKEDKDFINERVAFTQKNITEMLELIEQSKLYFSAEDYKDDEFKKGIELADKIDECIGNIYRSASEALMSIDELAENAEREIIKRSPTGIYLLNMRDVLHIANQQYELLTQENMTEPFSLTRDEEGNHNPERGKEILAQRLALAEPFIAEVEALSDKMDEMAKAHSEMDKSKLPSRLREKYDAFYKGIEAYKGSLRKIIRDFNERGYLDPKSVDNAYESLIKPYHEYIDVHNSGNVGK